MMQIYAHPTESRKPWPLKLRQLPEPDVPLCVLWKAQLFFSAAAVYEQLHGREALIERLEGRA